MLATAAIHKSRFARDPIIEGDCAAEAERYHEQCVSLLLPMLQDRVSITDGAFLACSTILRFYEEISGKSAPQSHLKPEDIFRFVHI